MGAAAFRPSLARALALGLVWAVGPSALRGQTWELAGLDVRLRGRTEMTGEWARFRPCEIGLQLTCDPGLFPRITPEIRFDLRVTGSVAERLQVDVDYDAAREFGAANRFRLGYRGGEGEFLRRVELGDVSLTFPASRFLTQGIPAGNFGVRAQGGVGALSWEGVWAQQTGELASRTLRWVGEPKGGGWVREDTLVLDDAGYVTGQFFFLVDPREFPTYPHVDILSLHPSSLPPATAPGPLPIRIYRLENEPVTRRQVEGYLLAEAVASGGGKEVREMGWFRRLEPGVDYLLHPSRLWLVLRRPLRPDEMLAAAYVTASGTAVGDHDPERVHNAGGRPRLRLLKAAGPRHQPGEPTWELEMHHVYRISGSEDLDEESVTVTVTLGEPSGGRTFQRGPGGESVPYLRLFGLDREAPWEAVDGRVLFRPAREDPGDPPAVPGTFLVFPTLRPFADPPPLAPWGLSPGRAGGLLGFDGNPAIYDHPDPVERAARALYRLVFTVRSRAQGVPASFFLGALGVREGSERIWLGERLLRAGLDYRVDYDIGQVTFLRPEELTTLPGATLRATWEQKPVFQVTPTSVLGFQSRYDLGDRGALHLLGLYQREQVLQRRPALGMEPSAALLGGVQGRYRFSVPWLDRLAAALPGSGTPAPAELRLEGEVAGSLPSPNTRGAVFLDDFDGSQELTLSLRAEDWKLGSAPESPEGLEKFAPAALDEGNAGRLVWQHIWLLHGPAGDSVGVFEGFLPARDVDREIRTAGAQVRQPGLRLTFQPRPAEKASWRSVTTLLSPSGVDLSRVDYLEFYAAGGEGLVLVVDLGEVSEDALFLDDQGRSSGVHPETGRPWGLGVLDQEADPTRGEIWDRSLDRRGMWGESCWGSPTGVFPLGDPRANCARGNGRSDTEDLDGDGFLSVQDRVVRYVLPLDGTSPYRVRGPQETGTAFSLYRIPLRGAGALAVQGRFTEAGWRAVKHLRLTVVGGVAGGVTLTRLRWVGSRWIQRGESGVLEGWAGTRAGLGGKVQVGPVSLLTEGGRYRSPPKVLEELDDPSQAFQGGGVEFGERSLGLEVTDLGPRERAEVYHRFPQRPRNFLTYRELRFWVLVPDGAWGGQEVEVFLKVGTDPDNFYLFRTRRSPLPSGAGLREGDWLPEVVISLEEWIRLRRRGEEELIRNPLPTGSPPLELWSPDSTYAVFLRDRARAPNLAAVREVALGVWNPGPGLVGGRVWFNELRLHRPVEEGGGAAFLGADLEVPGLLRAGLTFSRQGPHFRQLRNEASFEDQASLALRADLELGRLLPSPWGWSVPVAVSRLGTGGRPLFLPHTDLQAGGLRDLRVPDETQTRVELGVRKLTPVGQGVLASVLAGLSLGGGWTRTQRVGVASRFREEAWDGRAEFETRPAPKEFPLIPPALSPAVRAILPRQWESGVLGARFRWTPEQIRLATHYGEGEGKRWLYDDVVRRPSDSLERPVLSPFRTLEGSALLAFRPLESLSAELNWLSVRDLLAPGRAVDDPRAQRVLAGERRGAGPLSLGWEPTRRLETGLGFRPTLGPGVRGEAEIRTLYVSQRGGSWLGWRVESADTLWQLLRTAEGGRSTRLSLSVDPRAWVRETASRGRAAEKLLGWLEPWWVSRQGGISGRFLREAVEPGLGFQWGWGGKEAFAGVGDDSASILTERVSWNGGGGLRLPGGLRVGVGFSDSRWEVVQRGAPRRTEALTWPDLRVGLERGRWEGAWRGAMEGLSLSSGYRRTRAEADWGPDGEGGDPTRFLNVSEVSDARAGRGSGPLRPHRLRREDQVPAEAVLRLAGGFTLRYSGSFLWGEGQDPTGVTRSRRAVHGAGVSGAVRRRPGGGAELDEPLRVSFSYQYTSQVGCREPEGVGKCTPFLDLLDRTVAFSLEGIARPLAVGLQVSYTDRRSFVGRKERASQFQLGVYGQFLFENGQVTPGRELPR